MSKTLICGDCTDVNIYANIPDQSVDMILCDPPYGVTKNEWDTIIDYKKLMPILMRICKPNAAMVFFSQGIHTAQMMTGPLAKLWKYNLIWVKNKGRGFLNAKKMPMRYHEDILIFYKKPPSYNPQMVETGKKINACTRKTTGSNYGATENGENTRAGKTDRYPGSVLTFSVLNAEENIQHPTQKPVLLCEWLIKTYTNDGQTVLDMCMGSGTTGVACNNLNRKFIGIERDEKYFKISQDRIGNIPNTNKKRDREEGFVENEITDTKHPKKIKL